MANDLTPTFWERHGRWVAWVIVALAMGFFIWRIYFRFVPSFYGLADDHGYLTTAKRLATQVSFAQHQSDPYAFIGETMMQSPGDQATYYLRQPMGYPLVTAAAYFLGGADAPFAVNPLLGLALIFGIYRIGWRLGSPVGGAIAAGVIGANTLLLYYTIEPLSHVLDMTLAVWCVERGLAWRAGHQCWEAGLCGLLAGAAVLTRYVSVLLLLPLGVLILEEVKSGKLKSSKVLLHVGTAGGAMFVAIVPLLFYQAAAYGSMFRTGYSAGENGTSFSVAWFWEHAPAMGRILAFPEFGLTAMLLLAGFGVIVLARKSWFVPTLLLVWAIPSLIMYTAYYGMARNNMLLYARFALPSFVPLVLLGAVWPVAVVRREMAYWCVMAGAVVTVGWNCLFNPGMEKELIDHQNYQLYTFAAGLILRAEVPKGSVVIGDDFTDYFADYTGNYVVYDPSIFEGKMLERRLADLEARPHEFDPARTKQLQMLLGNRTDKERFAILRGRLARYAAEGKEVFLLTTDLQVDFWAKNLRLPMKSVAQNDIALHLFEIDAGAK